MGELPALDSPPVYAVPGVPAVGSSTPNQALGTAWSYHPRLQGDQSSIQKVLVRSDSTRDRHARPFLAVERRECSGSTVDLEGVGPYRP